METNNRFVLKKAKYTEKQKKAIVNHFSDFNKKVNVMIGAVNAIAAKIATETIKMLADRPDLYVHTVKYNANKTLVALEENKRNISKDYNQDKKLYEDYLDFVNQDFQKHIDMLYWQILSVLTKHEVSDRMIKTKVELARTMLEYSCHVFDKMMEYAQERAGFDFAQIYADRRNTKAYHYWKKVSSIICSTKDKSINIDLNSDANCRLAFEIIEKRLMSEDVLNNAGMQALKNNPNLVEKHESDEEIEYIINQ